MGVEVAGAVVELDIEVTERGEIAAQKIDVLIIQGHQRYRRMALGKACNDVGSRPWIIDAAVGGGDKGLNLGVFNAQIPIDIRCAGETHPSRKRRRFRELGPVSPTRREYLSKPRF